MFSLYLIIIHAFLYRNIRLCVYLIMPVFLYLNIRLSVYLIMPVFLYFIVPFLFVYMSSASPSILRLEHKALN